MSLHIHSLWVFSAGHPVPRLLQTPSQPQLKSTCFIKKRKKKKKSTQRQQGLRGGMRARPASGLDIKCFLGAVIPRLQRPVHMGGPRTAALPGHLPGDPGDTLQVGRRGYSVPSLCREVDTTIGTIMTGKGCGLSHQTSPHGTSGALPQGKSQEHSRHPLSTKPVFLDPSWPCAHLQAAVTAACRLRAGGSCCWSTTCEQG